MGLEFLWVEEEILIHQAEISQIIEKKENPEPSKSEDEENIDEAAAECAEEEKDEEGNCPTGPKKIPKITPEEEIFTTTYYEFPGNFTANLKGSKKSFFNSQLEFRLNMMNK